MKLYTEQQVIELTKASFTAGRNHNSFIFWEELKNITPIELPSDEEIWRWWQTQKFQKEQGEQEYTMLYEIDLPKILKSFTKHLIQGENK